MGRTRPACRRARTMRDARATAALAAGSGRRRSIQSSKRRTRWSQTRDRGSPRVACASHTVRRRDPQQRTFAREDDRRGWTSGSSGPGANADHTRAGTPHVLSGRDGSGSHTGPRRRRSGRTDGSPSACARRSSQSGIPSDRRRDRILVRDAGLAGDEAGGDDDRKSPPGGRSPAGAEAPAVAKALDRELERHARASRGAEVGVQRVGRREGDTVRPAAIADLRDQ